MAIRLDTASQYLCELSDWSLSNLQLQKLLYLAQVEHADKFDGAELVSEGFQAWDYGPVVPGLYRKLRIFGADAVENIFNEARELVEGSNSQKSLRRVWRKFGDVAPGELIELTHWERGAWAERYEPGVKGIPITHDDIVREARNRHRFADEWDRICAA